MLSTFTRIGRLLTYRAWPCYYCRVINYTSAVIWAQVKYTVVCERCLCQQDYPNHIRQFDPEAAP